MRVLLIVPNFRWVVSDPNTLWHYLPYNLCLLAATVKDLCDVSILDANKLNLNKTQFMDRVLKLRPDVVGLTVMMDEYGQTAHIAARLVKVTLPIPVILGGVYATTNAEEIMRDENIDYVVIGEAEIVFRELLLHLMEKTAELPSNGICYRLDGKVVNRGHSDPVQNLDALPLPDYSLIDFPSYASHAERPSVDGPPAYPYARVLTSRGCPFHCVFCQVETIMGRKFRGRSPSNVLHEIQWLKCQYGIKAVIFDDDNMLFDRNRAIKIFQGMIDLKMDLRWAMIATAVFEMDERLVQLMRESGCAYIDVAIESGSERVMQQVIRKPVNVDHAKKIIACARQNGIFVSANFVLGFPTETWDEIRQSLRVAEDVGADYVKIFSAIPLRHTALWDLCMETGSFKAGFDGGAVQWSTGQIETDEFKAEDLTILRAYEWDRLNFNSEEKADRISQRMGISRQQLNEIRKTTRAHVLKLIGK